MFTQEGLALGSALDAIEMSSNTVIFFRHNEPFYFGGVY
jgi:hypothetical protein